jgi:hypothetical protein
VRAAETLRAVALVGPDLHHVFADGQLALGGAHGKGIPNPR